MYASLPKRKRRLFSKREDGDSGEEGNNVSGESYSIKLPRTVEAKLEQLVRGLRQRREDQDRGVDMRHMLQAIREDVAAMAKMVKTVLRQREEEESSGKCNNNCVRVADGGCHCQSKLLPDPKFVPPGLLKLQAGMDTVERTIPTISITAASSTNSTWRSVKSKVL